MIPDALKAHLRAVTDRAQGGRYLSGGVACCGADGNEAAFLTGALRPGEAARDLDDRLGHRVRVASVSKAVTARATASLAADGVLSLEAPVFDLLEPHGYPDWLGRRGITAEDLLTHRSGLCDRAGYVTDPPEDLPAFLARCGPDMGADWPRGGYFFYANLNYVLLGAVIEAAAGQRFDRVVRDRVLAPLGIRGGFNWAGVPLAARAARLPLYQRHGEAMVLEADGPDGGWGADLIWRGGAGIGLGGYRIARDSFLFSPHAGLRLALAELARLARAFGGNDPAARLARAPRWVHDGTNGAWCGGLFPAFGLGLTLHRGHDRIPSTLAGHAGHALGFTGGAWCNLATGTGWAYFLTGSADETEGSDEESFFGPAELAVLRAF